MTENYDAILMLPDGQEPDETVTQLIKDIFLMRDNVNIEVQYIKNE